MQHQSTFAKSARSSLYNTSNKQYGTSWTQDGVRPENFDIKKATVPTYSEIVNSMNDFKKAQRLIKSKVIKQKLDQQGIEVDNPMRKTTEFPIKQPTYKYPQNGLKVGPSTYNTTSMNYGQSVPEQNQLPNKYYPCNSSFSKGFNGGNYKFNGLNTVKTVSGVHQKLNDF